MYYVEYAELRVPPAAALMLEHSHARCTFRESSRLAIARRPRAPTLCARPLSAESRRACWRAPSTTTMGKAIAKLAATDLEAARRMSDLAQTVSADIRAGRL